jgi:hypothetical protein
MSFTATSSNVTIIIQPPFGAAFTASNQASGSAIVNKSSGAAIGDGTVVVIDSVSGQGIELNMILANGSVNHTVYFSLQYTISN